MTTMTLIADAPVDVDAEGFLTDPEQWNEEIAAEIAARGRHRRADRPRTGRSCSFMRETLPRDRARRRRSARSARQSGVPIKELYELFPKGPAKLAAKIGGIPKPRGCI